MTRVRAFEAADLPAVTALLAERLPNGPWARTPDFLRQSLVDYPGADPDLPSLVAVDDTGAIRGFIGVQTRRARLGGTELRCVCCSHLVAGEDAGPAAALLLRQMLAGPQDLTVTDSAIDPVARAWRRLGGQPDISRCSDWMLALGPGRFALRSLRSIRALAQAKVAQERAWQRLVPVAAIPLQVAGRRMIEGAFPEPPREVSGEAADTSKLAALAEAITGGAGLQVVHDATYLAHTFQLIEMTSRNRLVRRLVRRAGKPVGWYVFEQQPDRTARVLALAAPEHEVEAVFFDLFGHARATGNSILTGRVEPHLIAALRRRLAAIGLARQPMIHARDPAVALALTTPASRLSLLDTEWWA